MVGLSKDRNQTNCRKENAKNWTFRNCQENIFQNKLLPKFFQNYTDYIVDQKTSICIFHDANNMHSLIMKETVREVVIRSKCSCTPENYEPQIIGKIIKNSRNEMQ